MRKGIKRTLAVILAVCMVMAGSITSFASEIPELSTVEVCGEDTVRSACVEDISEILCEESITEEIPQENDIDTPEKSEDEGRLGEDPIIWGTGYRWLERWDDTSGMTSDDPYIKFGGLMRLADGYPRHWAINMPVNEYADGQFIRNFTVQTRTDGDGYFNFTIRPADGEAWQDADYTWKFDPPNHDYWRHAQPVMTYHPQFRSGEFGNIEVTQSAPEDPEQTATIRYIFGYKKGEEIGELPGCAVDLEYCAESGEWKTLPGFTGLTSREVVIPAAVLKEAAGDHDRITLRLAHYCTSGCHCHTEDSFSEGFEAELCWTEKHRIEYSRGEGYTIDANDRYFEGVYDRIITISIKDGYTAKYGIPSVNGANTTIEYIGHFGDNYSFRITTERDTTIKVEWIVPCYQIVLNPLEEEFAPQVIKTLEVKYQVPKKLLSDGTPVAFWTLENTGVVYYPGDTLRFGRLGIINLFAGYSENPGKGDDDPGSSGTSYYVTVQKPAFTGNAGNPVTDGVWSQHADGTWSYRTNAVFKNTWGYIANPYAAGKAAWFYFDANGKMLTGWQWIKDKDGATRCYYLNPISDSTLGACFMGPGTTPDGWTVNADGAWTVNGAVQIR